jgi:hypothetical protein
MSDANNLPTDNAATPLDSEAQRTEAAVAAIEGLCGGLWCDGYFMHISRDIMAIACERHPKVLSWWQTMVALGHPKAPVVWVEIQARMDARAAARAIESAIDSD